MSQVFLGIDAATPTAPAWPTWWSLAAGVNVVIDSDQAASRGPNEGWPKWSRRQVHLAE